MREEIATLGTQNRYEQLKAQHGQAKACEMFRLEVESEWAFWWLEEHNMTRAEYDKMWEDEKDRRGRV